MDASRIRQGKSPSDALEVRLHHMAAMGLSSPVQIQPPLLYHPLFKLGTGPPEITLCLMDRFVDADERFVEK